MAEVKVPAPQRKSREAPPLREQVLNNLEKPSPSETETLNFRVTPAFKNEFKGYAASHGLTMVQLLKRGYELVKKEIGR